MEDLRLKTKEVLRRVEETCGEFTTEQEGVSLLLSRLNQTGAFSIYTEVAGTILQPRPGADQIRVRADVLLTPRKLLIDAGWHSGAICIECKAPNTRLGKPVCQSMDYMRSGFRIPPSMTMIIPSYCFIWHSLHFFNSLGSIAAQNNIGSAHVDRRGTLIMRINAAHVLNFNATGGIEVVRNPASGNKAGSR